MKIKQAAFTLIEVMIAMVIIAIAFTAILRTTNIVLDGSSHLQQHQIAQWVASDILTAAQIGSLTLPINNKTLAGKTKMLGQNFDWVLQRRSSRFHGMEQLSITVKQNDQTLYLLHGSHLIKSNEVTT